MNGMRLRPYEIDSSHMPVGLGSALRVPSYAYESWGIPTGSNRRASNRQYEIEWKGGSPRQMEYVIEALKGARLGNYSQMLRDANARLVSKIVRDSKERVNYLEPGAGVSTVCVYKKLIEDGVDAEKLHGTLVEPSKKRLGDAVAELKKLGLRQGKHFTAHAARDTDVNRFVRNGSQDVVAYVATLHHHAYIDTPLLCMYNATKPGGLIIIADWHNSMWEHPNRVYEFLKRSFRWPTKEKDLKAFVRAYPKALERAPPHIEVDEEANRQIRRFWKGWKAVRRREIKKGVFRPEDDIFMHEGHRPVEMQVEEMKQVGYVLDDNYVGILMTANPLPLLPESSILYVTVGRKPFENT